MYSVFSYFAFFTLGPTTAQHKRNGLRALHPVRKSVSQGSIFNGQASMVSPPTRLLPKLHFLSPLDHVHSTAEIRRFDLGRCYLTPVAVGSGSEFFLTTQKPQLFVLQPSLDTSVQGC
ncbi:hypothetical protein F5Y06DRAFT_79397 [Hypoxylon sp. FL0890]|nr:hypothetical protein F5Y06DRAFT_79397 [Hypoxylon sp. FL0890]